MISQSRLNPGLFFFFNFSGICIEERNRASAFWVDFGFKYIHKCKKKTNSKQ